MKRIRNILLPTDFSPNSESALKYAICLAKDLNAKITVMHAYRLVQPVVPIDDDSPFSIKHQWETATWEKMHELETRYLMNSGIKYDFEVGIGFATDAICNVIENNEIDLLIIGKNGRGSLGRMFGSTALELLDCATCPVLIIPMDAVYNSGIKNAIMSYDFKGVHNKKNWNSVTEMLKDLHVFLEVLNVNGTLSKANGAFSNFESSLKGIEHHYEFISGKKVDESIIEYITHHQFDLLITLHKEHDIIHKIFQGSITKKLALHSTLPLLTFKES